jgi:hypothetical protein
LVDHSLLIVRRSPHLLLDLSRGSGHLTAHQGAVDSVTFYHFQLWLLWLEFLLFSHHRDFDVCKLVHI